MIKYILIAIIALIALGALLLFLLSGRREHPAWKVLGSYRYAHRGFHYKPRVPENSMAAFRLAVERGWGAELDVHILKDGKLAVFHDSELERCTGASGIIEELDSEQLKELRLEGTDEHVPMLEEVLELFEGKAPLIIELKTYKGNHARLAKAAGELLDEYKGDFCVESFDPRALAYLRGHRPNICRGQLSMGFTEDNCELSAPTRFLLRNLLLNVIARPDFIAYEFESRDKFCLRLATRILGLREVSWTIRSREDMDTCEREGRLVIFENFDPEV